MAYGNVDVEALKEVVAALDVYIAEMNNHIQKTKDAAQDCSDNMGSDRYSAKAVEDLDESIHRLERAMDDAEEIRKAIIDTINEIEEE